MQGIASDPPGVGGIYFGRIGAWNAAGVDKKALHIDTVAGCIAVGGIFICHGVGAKPDSFFLLTIKIEPDFIDKLNRQGVGYFSGNKEVFGRVA